MIDEVNIIIAKAIWDYNECPWDFENPPEGMAKLQKQISLDQAAVIISRLHLARKKII